MPCIRKYVHVFVNMYVEVHVYTTREWAENEVRSEPNMRANMGNNIEIMKLLPHLFSESTVVQSPYVCYQL